MEHQINSEAFALLNLHNMLLQELYAHHFRGAPEALAAKMEALRTRLLVSAKPTGPSPEEKVFESKLNTAVFLDRFHEATRQRL